MISDIKSQSSMSNPYEVLSTSSALQDWDNVDARRRQGTPITFTAYDNTGRPHQKQYAPSTSEYPSGPRPPGPDAVLPTCTVSSSYRTIPAQRSGSGYSQPSPVRPAVDTGRKNSKWAKPVSTPFFFMRGRSWCRNRLAPVQLLPIPHQSEGKETRAATVPKTLTDCLTGVFSNSRHGISTWQWSFRKKFHGAYFLLFSLPFPLDLEWEYCGFCFAAS